MFICICIVLNTRGTNTLPVKEFAHNLNQFTNNEITISESNALSKECDVFHKGKISYTDIEYFLSKQKNQQIDSGICLSKYKMNANPLSDFDNQIVSVNNKSAIQELINDHPVFPNWLTSRSDFSEYYMELLGENGVPTNAIIEGILKTKVTDRKSSDVSVLCKWIKLNKILSYLRPNRLMDVCRYVIYTYIGFL